MAPYREFWTDALDIHPARAGGYAAGTRWEDLPDDFECPLCGVGKDSFSEEA